MKYHSVDDYGERCPFDVTINARESRSGKDNDLYVDTNNVARSRVGHTQPDGSRARRDARSRVGVPDQGGVPVVGTETIVDEDRGRSDIPVEDRGRSKGDFVAEVNVCAR